VLNWGFLSQEIQNAECCAESTENNTGSSNRKQLQENTFLKLVLQTVHGVVLDPSLIFFTDEA
jgi:hypothetical protein